MDLDLLTVHIKYSEPELQDDFGYSSVTLYELTERGRELLKH
jgi:hypothetical protein